MRIRIRASRKHQNSSIFGEDVKTLKNACKHIAEYYLLGDEDIDSESTKPTYEDAYMLARSDNWIGSIEEAYQTLLSIWRAREPREVEKENALREEQFSMCEDAFDVIKELERAHNVQVKWGGISDPGNWFLNDEVGNRIGRITVDS